MAAKISARVVKHPEAQGGKLEIYFFKGKPHMSALIFKLPYEDFERIHGEVENNHLTSDYKKNRKKDKGNNA